MRVTSQAVSLLDPLIIMLFKPEALVRNEGPEADPRIDAANTLAPLRLHRSALAQRRKTDPLEENVWVNRVSSAVSDGMPS